MPSAIVGGRLDRDRVAGRERARERRHRLGLHADHADRRAAALAATAMPGGQAAAADRHHDRAHLRALLDDLQADRALAGDHVRVLERMDEDGAGLRRRARARGSGHPRPARRAGRPRRRRTGWPRPWAAGRPAGMTTVALVPSSGRGEGHALGVIAGAGRDHPAGPLGVREPGDAQVGAADLERPGPLQVLALEVDRPADPARTAPGSAAAASAGRRRGARSRAATTSSMPDRKVPMSRVDVSGLAAAGAVSRGPVAVGREDQRGGADQARALAERGGHDADLRG